MSDGQSRLTSLARRIDTGTTEHGANGTSRFDGALRRVLQSVSEDFAWLDAEGRIVDVSRRPAWLTDMPLAGQPASAYLPLGMNAPLEEALLMACDGDAPVEFEARGTSPTGHLIWLAGRVARLADEEGRAGYLLHLFDISARKQRDQELMLGHQRISEAQRLAGIGCWEWNLESGGLWWSDAMFRMFGQELNEFTPTYDAFLELVVAEDQRLIQDRIDACLQRDEPLVLTYRIRHMDGSLRVISAQAKLYHDPYGNPQRLVGMCQDITEQRRIQMQLRRTERLAALGTLAAGIAHEINNPMAAAMTAAETAKLLRNRPDAAEMLDECLSAISDAVCRSQVIIENVLRFARHESSNKQPHDLNAIVFRAVETTTHYAERHRSRVELDLADRLPHPLINGPEIEQVLVNLIRNAVQAGTNTQVCISTEAGFQVVRLRISDDGRGIATDQLEHVFDPFFTAREGGRGTGLGLAISHAIVEDHEGMIEVESQLGVGTTFTLTLPVTPSNAIKKPPHFRTRPIWLDPLG
ncbi:MAG: PAS domain-containing protein [Planctomycetales bacterium]|nr:PAS domain-containing protein [Planctomycetales bacterium]